MADHYFWCIRLCVCVCAIDACDRDVKCQLAHWFSCNRNILYVVLYNQHSINNKHWFPIISRQRRVWVMPHTRARTQIEITLICGAFYYLRDASNAQRCVCVCASVVVDCCVGHPFEWHYNGCFGTNRIQSERWEMDFAADAMPTQSFWLHSRRLHRLITFELWVDCSHCILVKFLACATLANKYHEFQSHMNQTWTVHRIVRLCINHIRNGRWSGAQTWFGE